MAEGLVTQPRAAAIKGWSVSTKQPVEKAAVFGRAAPLLVHQTLANREQVLVCACCHHFVGTPATQLAMLEGLSRDGTTTASTSTTKSKKRRRSSDSPTTNTAPSRRSAVASAPPSHLPDLPTFQTTPKGQEEGEEQGRGEIWRCKGGAPCGDVYCSSGCQEAALAAGHGLICIGGSGEGSPLFEFHRYAVRTSETYLIAAAAVASVLSTYLSSTEGVGEDSDDGIRSFEALEGWAEPHMSPSRGDDDDDEEIVDEGGGRRTTKGTTGEVGGGGRGGGQGGTIGFAAVKDIGVSMEEAEEAWSLLTAGLVHGRGVLGSSYRAATATPTTRDRGVGGRRSVERALSLDFFLRVVRALGRHLAPISVSSPLVSYCARLVQASPERKARALPWLAPAVERAGPFAGADGADEAGIDKPCQPSSTAEGRGRPTAELRKRGGEVNGIGQEDEEDDAVIVGERGLCRLVQASAAVAVGTAASPFPPLSVVGLLPTHCSPQHSCVPNVQLEASLLPATKSADEKAQPADGVHETEKQVSSSTALRVGLVALRRVQAGEELFAPYIALGQPMQARQRELSSRFFAGRSASGGFAAASATGAGASVSAAAVAAEVADTAPTGSCSLPGLSSLQRQPPQLVCNCPRCLLEAGGDHRLCGREMLKVLADQALEEGRHEAALGLYRASLAVRPPSPSLSSKASSCTPAPVAADTRAPSGANNSGTTRREGGHLTACDPSSLIAAAAATAAVAPGEGEGGNDASGARTAAVAEEESGGLERAAAEPAEQPEQEAAAAVLKGDALHGIGVALLAAGKFREACRAWERGFRDAPNHPALRAQAEKEAAYRPKAENGANAGECGGAEGPSPEKQGKRIIGASPAQGLHGDSSDDDTHLCFSSIPGRAADIFLSRERVLSPEECRGVIQAAEDYSQANGGWTTSRHYAVPTTDLPVHVLKSTLPWFRSLVRERLFPALAKRFNLAAGPRRVFVHDAFVVRYEEGKQRHLPLHRDQSTHSFTIALNGLNQYTGGGTFFPSLGRSLRPAEGHALSFRGGILHGGDPLLKGVRYIIACFCYYEDGGDSDEEVAKEGGGELGSADSRLEAKRRENCKNVEGKPLGGSSSAVDSSNAGSGSTSPTERSGGENGRAGGDGATREGKGASIEFRSDKAFSFGFGFG